MDKFILKIIGSGTMMPTKTRHPSCYILEAGEKKILLDLGHTSLSRLIELGINPHSIDAVFISHFHTDHFADLLPLVHARWVDDVQNVKKHKKLKIIGPKTIQKRWKKLREVFWVEPEEHYPLEFSEGVKSFKQGDLLIDIFEVKHVQWYQSVGIKVTLGGKSFVYTGDIGSDQGLEKLEQIARKADLLLVEAGNIKPTPNHFTIQQVVELANGCQAKQTVATHLRDESLPFFEKALKGQNNIILAKDLLEIEI